MTIKGGKKGKSDFGHFHPFPALSHAEKEQLRRDCSEEVSERKDKRSFVSNYCAIPPLTLKHVHFVAIVS